MTQKPLPSQYSNLMNGLYAIAKHQLNLNHVDGSLFIFCNKSRTRKALRMSVGSTHKYNFKEVEKLNIDEILF